MSEQANQYVKEKELSEPFALIVNHTFCTVQNDIGKEQYAAVSGNKLNPTAQSKAQKCLVRIFMSADSEEI